MIVHRAEAFEELHPHARAADDGSENRGQTHHQHHRRVCRIAKKFVFDVQVVGVDLWHFYLLRLLVAVWPRLLCVAAVVFEFFLHHGHLGIAQ